MVKHNTKNENFPVILHIFPLVLLQINTAWSRNSSLTLLMLKLHPITDWGTFSSDYNTNCQNYLSDEFYQNLLFTNRLRPKEGQSLGLSKLFAVLVSFLAFLI